MSANPATAPEDEGGSVAPETSEDERGDD
jgi:hypothetical protein